MTPEERFEAHEQWLLDHDRTIKEISDIQRRQAAVLLEISQHVARLLDRSNGGDPDQ
jgi:hypothetical protein